MKRFILATAIALAMGAVPAFAGAAPEAQTIQVSYQDLDLSHTDDAAAFLSRLQYASVRACAGEQVVRPSSAERRAIRECRDQAVARVVAQINAPELTRLYEQSVAPPEPQTTASR